MFGALVSVLLVAGVVTGARADVIEDLTFTGVMTCDDSNCSSFGSGPIVGTYSLDVTTQAIVGPWSFSTPLGVMSSATAGASGFLVDRFGDINPGFSESTPVEFVQFFFNASDAQELGPLATNVNSDGCTPASATSCFPDYIITGQNQLSGTVPEPSTIGLLGIALLLIARRRAPVRV